MRKKPLVLGIVAIVAVPLIFLALHRPDDGFNDLRNLGGVETVKTSPGWVWHQFQFPDTCQVVAKELAAWPSRHTDLVMTDLEGPDRVHIVWAGPGHRTIQGPIPFKPGMSCGVWIGARPQRSWLDRMLRFLKIRS